MLRRLLAAGLVLGALGLAPAAADAADAPAPSAAADVLDAAADVVRKAAATGENPTGAATRLKELGEAYAAVGLAPQAGEALDDALEFARDAPTARHLLLAIGEACVRAGLHERAVRVAEQLDYVPHAVHLLCQTAEAELQLGRREQALAALAEARRLTAGLPAGHAASRGWVRLAQVYAAGGMTAESDEALEHALRQALHAESDLLRSTEAEAVAEAYMKQGRLEDALEVAEHVPLAAVRAAVLHAAAQKAVAAGDPERALTVIGRAREQADALPDATRRANALIKVAHAYRQAGRTKAAAAALATAEEATALIPQAHLLAATQEALADAHVAAGDLESAERIIEQEGDAARRAQRLMRLAVSYAEHGRPEETNRIVSAVDPQLLPPGGKGVLRDAAEAYFSAWGKDAKRERIAELELSGLRDAVLARYASAWLADGDYARALDFAQAIEFPVTHDEALMDVAVQCLKGAQSPALMAPAYDVLGLLAGRLDRLRLLSRLAARHAQLGQAAEATVAASTLAEDLEQERVQSARAEMLAELAATYKSLGRSAEAQEAAVQSIVTAMKIDCASCRDEVLETVFAGLSGSDCANLAPEAAERIELPRLRAESLLQVLAASADLAPPQTERLLRAALSAAAEVEALEHKVGLMVRVASGYARAGLATTDFERGVLARLAAAPVRAAPARRAPPPATRTRPTRLTRLAYFGRAGCPLCGEVEQHLTALHEELPGLIVDRYDLDAGSDAALLNKAICEGLGIPRQNHLVVPAVFSAKGGLVGDELTAGGLSALARAAQGEPSPAVLFGGRREEARSGIAAMYDDLGPLVIVSAGLADGINPCAFTVIIFFLAYLAHIGRDRRQIAVTGIVFTLAVFVTYFAVGVALSSLVGRLQGQSDLIRRVTYGVTAGLALTAAALSLRDGLRARAGRVEDLTLSLPESLKKRIRLTISQKARLGLTVGTTLVLGALVALFELPCTGQVYFVVIVALRELPVGRWGPIGWLLLYNLCFIVPLVIVFALVFFGLTSERLTTVFRRHIAKTKFAMAAVFAALGAFMLRYLF